MIWLNHIGSIAAFILILTAIIGVGRRLMRVLNIETLTLPGEIALSFAFGMPLYIYALQIVGYSGILYKSVIIALVLIGIILCFGEIKKLLHKIRMRIAGGIGGGAVLFIIASILIALLALTFIANLAPMVGGDADSFHYNHPKRFLQAHKIYYMEGSRFADYPWAHETFTLIAFSFGCEGAANLFNWFFFILAILFFLEIGAKLKIPEAGPAMAMVLIGMRSVWEFLVPAGYIEPLLIFLTIPALYYFYEWLDDPQPRYAIATGLFIGLLGATKYNGLILAAFILVVSIIAALFAKDRFLRLKQFGLMLLIFIILTLPFEGLNLIRHGNPVYPFLHEALTGEVVPGSDDIGSWAGADVPSLWGGIKHFFIVTLNKTYSYTNYAVVITPLIFLLFIKKRRIALTMLYVVVHFALAYIMMPWHTRYFLPGVMAMIYMIGISMGYIRAAIFRQIVCVALIIIFLLNIGEIYNGIKPKFPVVAGMISSEDYISSQDKFFKVIFESNRLTGEDDTVWFLDRRAYRLDANYIESPRNIPEDWVRDNSEFHASLVNNGIDWIVISRMYWELAGSVDAITSSIRPGDKGDVRLFWPDIAEKLESVGLSDALASNLVFAMGAKAVSRGRYTIDEDYIRAHWPNVDYNAAIVMSLPGMEKDGYVVLRYHNLGGWIYEVLDNGDGPIY